MCSSDLTYEVRILQGAGKTTALRVLTTLLRPDGGRAEVAGFDVVRQADEVRHRIGLVGQNAAVDEILSGRQNLVMFGRLFHLPVREAQRRADELLDRFGLADTGRKPVKQYSGGMRGDSVLSITVHDPADRKSTRLNSSHESTSRMPSSA